jgi:hypothetical protein
VREAQFRIDPPRLAVARHGGFGKRPGVLQDLRPAPPQIGHVGDEILVGCLFRHGPDDEAAALVGAHEALHPFSQQHALGLAGYALRDADMRVLRQVDQQAAGNADLGRETCTLGADRILQDLHQQHLAFVEVFLDRLDAVFAARLPQVGDVQEGGALEADVDECRLHSRQHPRHHPHVDVPHQAPGGFAVQVKFLQDALVHDGDPQFLRCRIDQDVFFHGAVIGAWDTLPCAAAGRFRKGANP